MKQHKKFIFIDVILIFRTIFLLSVFVLLIRCEKKDELIMQMYCQGGLYQIKTPATPGDYRIDAASEPGSSSAFFSVAEDIRGRVQDEHFVLNDISETNPDDLTYAQINASDPVSSIIIEYDMYPPGETIRILLPQGNTTLSVYKL
jgi:hypothetical protein